MNCAVLSFPILSCAEARAWEKRILPDESLEWPAMQRAGEQVALSILEDFEEIGGFPPEGRILILCGKGHNAGDALLAASVVLSRFPGATVDAVFCMGTAALRPLAARALKTLREAAGGRFREVTPADLTRLFHPRNENGPPSVSWSRSAPAAVDERTTARAPWLHEISGLRHNFPGYDLCLEGVFGFQFRPPMDPATAELISLVNASSRIRFRAAVDLPGGIAESRGSTAFRADFTYATGIVKSPVVAEANRDCVGRLRWLDLGFFAEENPAAPERILSGRLLTPLGEMRPAGSDKRTFGHLCVVGGSHRYPGAVVLAVRAALRSGVGLVSAFVPEPLAPRLASDHPEVMWSGCPLNANGGLTPESLNLMGESLQKADAILIGPGLGADPATLELVRRLAAEAELPVVVDADALQPEVIRELSDKPFVCTPHAGELKRIAPALYQADRLAAGRGVLVAKGPLTHVTDGKTRYYSPFGGPVLARGGSGDMLAGLIGGLLAQTPGNPILAACRGVVWHGLAADLLARARGQVAVENSQLLEQLGPALKSTHGRHIDTGADWNRRAASAPRPA